MYLINGKVLYKLIEEFYNAPWWRKVSVSPDEDISP